MCFYDLVNSQLRSYVSPFQYSLDGPLGYPVTLGLDQLLSRSDISLFTKSFGLICGQYVYFQE